MYIEEQVIACTVWKREGEILKKREREREYHTYLIGSISGERHNKYR